MGSTVNSIRHNMLSMFSDRQYGITVNTLASSAEKLSSGYRINRSADDAAGLSISEKMRRQIRGLQQSVLNAQDGISMVQTADGALAEVHDMLHRGSELAIKAANGTLSDTDRKMINDEIEEIKREIDRSTLAAKFNETYLFSSEGCTVTPASAGFTRSAESVNNPGYNWKTGKFDAQIKFNPDGSIGDVEASERADSSGGVGGASGAASYSRLGDKIINEYVPNAVTQILNAFPALGNGVDFSNLGMSLEIGEIDGPSNTLAFVRAGFMLPGQTLSGLELVVDMADFSDSSIDDDSSVAKLESTLAHEMMHAVMDVATPANMYQNGQTEDYPKWFKEGTAQLAGGGFPTNWNARLEQYAQDMSSANDSSQDDKIAAYLKTATVEGRPYGHGYLASAYMGYLAAGGSGDITGQKIADGINQIFAAIRAAPPGTSFDSIVQSQTGGKSPAQIADAINNADPGAVEFVRKLSYNATGNGSKGAGSVITPSLSTGGANILADSATPASSPLNIDPDKVKVPDPEPGAGKVTGGKKGGIALHVGADSLSNNKIDMLLFNVNTSGLRLTETNTKTMKDAYKAMDEFQGAIQVISFVRSYYGAIQNRLEHTIKNLGNVLENTTSTESAIRDTDMAKEMVRYSNNNILRQVGESMLSQANNSKQGVISLLSA
ncbi:MAG: flagellinolysin [Lachnospiraceae bacterium]|nr:flagellinolysin [Lachnospiraceae bacterium]